MTLKDLKIGESAIIDSVGGEGSLRQHFLDMGMIPGAKVKFIKLAPMGDPMELLIHGYELTLRIEDADKIQITALNYDIEDEAKSDADERKKELQHPMLGEPGLAHERQKLKTSEIPKDKTLTFALVGNQNSGKTTLFNQLTGANQHVGNFPGVTVDRKDGEIRGHSNTLITDLPGIYSMSPYSSEELVSRDFVLNEKPNAIINIVDATNIERNLYLTMQLLEMDRPIVVALNMMDELTGNGGMIDVNAMEQILGTPVVPISAAKNEGVDELVIHALHIAHYQEKPLEQDFCSEEDHGGAVHRCLHAVMNLIEDHAARVGIPLRFAASKCIENDRLIIEKLQLDQNELETLEHISKQMETERKLDRSAAIADMRFSFIKKVCDRCVQKPHESKEHVRSRKMDDLLTGKYTAIPIFIGIMALIFHLTFNVIGAFLQDLLDEGIGALTDIVDETLTEAGVNDAVHDLIVSGIFEGVGSVLSFIPIVVTMFFFLSILEDSGYIARVAFFMDKLLRKIGLSGRSIVPMLIGFGCSVPAINRVMTILLTPFMSCTAKLPIYAFFVDAFFDEHAGLVMTGLYLLGIICGIVIAFLYKKALFKGEAVPFVMELPNYRMPSPRSVIQLMWEKAKDFLYRAFSVIMVATIVVWFLQSFDFQLNMVDDSEESMMAGIAGWLVPIFAPLGLGDWRICTSFISGFMAKESVVAVLEVLFSGNVATMISPITAGTILVFSLLYTPCVAAIATVKRELGGKWAVAVVFWQCAIAWIVALLFKIIATPFLS